MMVKGERKEFIPSKYLSTRIQAFIKRTLDLAEIISAGMGGILVRPPRRTISEYNSELFRVIELERWIIEKYNERISASNK